MHLPQVGSTFLSPFYIWLHPSVSKAVVGWPQIVLFLNLLIGTQEMILLTPKLKAVPILLLTEVEVVVLLSPLSVINFLLIGVLFSVPVLLVPLSGELLTLDDLLLHLDSHLPLSSSHCSVQSWLFLYFK